jgi:hypothetical protein
LSLFSKVYHGCGLFRFRITAIFGKREIVYIFFTSATTNMCHHSFKKNSLRIIQTVLYSLLDCSLTEKTMGKFNCISSGTPGVYKNISLRILQMEVTVFFS